MGTAASHSDSFPWLVSRQNRRFEFFLLPSIVHAWTDWQSRDEVPAHTPLTQTISPLQEVYFSNTAKEGKIGYEENTHS